MGDLKIQGMFGLEGEKKRGRGCCSEINARCPAAGVRWLLGAKPGPGLGSPWEADLGVIGAYLRLRDLLEGLPGKEVGCPPRVV